MKNLFINISGLSKSFIKKFVIIPFVFTLIGATLGVLTFKLSWKAPLVLLGIFFLGFIFFVPEMYLLTYLFVDQTPFLQLRKEIFLLLFSSWTIYVLVHKIRIIATPIEAMVIAFSILYTLSSIITGPFFQVVDYLNLIVLYFLVSTVIDSEVRLKRLIYGFIIWGLYLSFGGILQVFLQKAIFPTSLGLGDPSESVIVLAVGSYGDPVVYARSVQFAMILCFFQILASNSKRTRLVLTVIMVFLTLGWFISGNRSTMISFIFILIFISIIDRRIPFKLIFFILIALFLIPWFILPDIIQRYQTILPSLFSFYEYEINIRSSLSISAIQFLVDHPIRLFTGVGASNFPVFVLPYLKEALPLGLTGGGYTTSSIIVVLVEGGIISIILLLSASLWAMLQIIKTRRLYKEKANQEMFNIATGILILEIGLLVQFVFTNVVYTYLFWLPLGLITAIKRISLKDSR